MWVEMFSMVYCRVCGVSSCGVVGMLMFGLLQAR